MSRSFNPVYSARPESIFPTMSKLARKSEAINLGQGFPDEDGPLEVREAAARAILEGPNQYAPVEGTPALREAVARDNKRFYDLDIDPMTETLVVCGATEGLAAVFQGLLEPGDEAVLLAPFYESYAPQIEAAGGVLRFVNLTPPAWRLDADALESAITSKTKLIVINTPHNPLAKMMSVAELEIVADAARRHDLYVVCDEVYERMVFDGAAHVPLMTLPEMRERAIRIGSAGKTFSLTGFRVGYITACAPLITAIMKAHTHLAYVSPTALEHAVTAGLNLGDRYFADFTATLQAKRDLFASGLAAAGFEVLPCDGTYFVIVDIRSVGRDDDNAFCREIAEKAKVAAVPVSAFYHPSQTDVSRHYARFCFCKKPEVLEEAASRLAAYFGK
jgi:N-succinyldiaminopimelate aminotransferase